MLSIFRSHNTYGKKGCNSMPSSPTTPSGYWYPSGQCYFGGWWLLLLYNNDSRNERTTFKRLSPMEALLSEYISFFRDATRGTWKSHKFSICSVHPWEQPAACSGTYVTHTQPAVNFYQPLVEYLSHRFWHHRWNTISWRRGVGTHISWAIHDAQEESPMCGTPFKLHFIATHHHYGSWVRKPMEQAAQEYNSHHHIHSQQGS